MKTDMDKNMDADTDISMSTDKNMFTSMSVSVSLFIIMFMGDFVTLISTDKFQDIYMDRDMANGLERGYGLGPWHGRSSCSCSCSCHASTAVARSL